ncbi:MAG: hypothetical protein ABIH86_01125 [Planctomycetota bacterium]
MWTEFEKAMLAALERWHASAVGASEDDWVERYKACRKVIAQTPNIDDATRSNAYSMMYGYINRYPREDFHWVEGSRVVSIGEDHDGVRVDGIVQQGDDMYIIQHVFSSISIPASLIGDPDAYSTLKTESVISAMNANGTHVIGCIYNIIEICPLRRDEYIEEDSFFEAVDDWYSDASRYARRVINVGERE